MQTIQTQETAQGEVFPAQERFNRTYITASEIMRELGVSRAVMLYARRTGRLPNAITVQEGNLYIWERESIQPYIDAWKVSINFRRGEAING